MVVVNCKGCEEEWRVMCEYVEQGYHIAVTDDCVNTYPIRRGHYRILIVDDNGNIIIN